MRWPFGPPHLALNPPYLFLFFVFFLGSGEVARRATSLGTKPSLFVCCFVFFFFPFFASSRKNPVFPLEKAFLFIFECLPLFLLSLFLASPFFNCSFSVSLLLFFLLLLLLLLFFLSSFLSFFFAFFCFLVFVSFFHFLFCFCFMKRTTSKYSITKFLFINIFSLFLFSVLFSI